MEECLPLEWYVATTQRHRDRVAERELRNQGFVPFIPTYHDPIPGKSVRECTKLLVPGYVLINFNVDKSAWRSINGTRGVGHLLMSDEMPCRIRRGVVQELKRLARVRVITKDEADSVIFSVGDMVRVNEGPFKEFSGLVERTSHDRIRVMLEVFGRKTPVEIGKRALSVSQPFGVV